jgi:hypothetical protein
MAEPMTEQNTAQPPLPPRPGQEQHQLSEAPPEYQILPPATQQNFPPPPQRKRFSAAQQEDISSPIHYTRDPHKLVAYLVPFPKPNLQNMPTDAIPQRFLIYTPPPPPLNKPAEGEKESKVHKIQRKWEEEIRQAKTYTGKTASWKGVKSKVTRGINWGMSQTKSSNLEFLNRIGANKAPEPDEHAEDDGTEGEDTKATVKLEEMLLVYPSSMPGDSEQIRQEFVNTMLRSKSKAERDAVIATGLLPVSAAIDILATLVWPFGGLLEIDAVWAYASIRGAKTSRSVTKRLTSSTSHLGEGEKEDKLHLNFTPSSRLAVLEHYLAAACHERDSKLFPSTGAASTPTETQVLEAIGWTPSSKGGEERNWEDEQWEISEVKDDLREVMRKGAREWDKWCKVFEKEPEKAMKK